MKEGPQREGVKMAKEGLRPILNGMMSSQSGQLLKRPSATSDRIEIGGGFPGGSDGEKSPCNTGDMCLVLGLGRSPEKGKATHSRILAWRIPWTEELGGYSPRRGPKESDTTEQLTLSLQHIQEGFLREQVLPPPGML